MRNLYFKILIIILFIAISAENFSQISLRFLAKKYLLEKSKSIISTSVEVKTFKSSVIENDVNLFWETKGETSPHKFVVERMSSEDMTWKPAGEVTTSGNSNLINSYSYIDKSVEGGFYSYRLKMINDDGSFEFSKEIHSEVNIAEDFKLSQNYPNPFNPSTTITFSLPEKRFVSLAVYNVLGNEIAAIVNEEKPAGVYTVSFDVSELDYELSNGTYFYRLKAGDYTETKKMIYIK